MHKLFHLVPLFDSTMPKPAGSLKSSSHYLVDGPGQETWLIWYQQVSKNNHAISIWVAEDITPLRHQHTTIHLLRDYFNCDNDYDADSSSTSHATEFIRRV